MSQFLVTPSISADKNFAFFRLNVSLGLSEKQTFTSVEAAKDFPLVQQMFYLPFVKSVTLHDHGLEVERFDILDWQDVIEEVATEISSYLNNGGEIGTLAPPKQVPVTVYAESTPNPAVMKFVANKPLTDRVFEFKSLEDTEEAPLAAALFSFAFVKELFFDANYISINKTEEVSWEEVVMEVREFIRSYLSEGKTVVKASSQAKNVQVLQTPIEELDETSQSIVKIIEEYIKPAVASDGGNIVFENYNPDDQSVQVVLQGACSGCPSSTLTLKNGIETMLQDMLPGKVKSVSAING